MANKIKVTLTRVYEYDISEIQSKLKKAGYKDKEIDSDLLKYTAKTEALDDFSCEMVYFEEDINDFVGATAEIIDQITVDKQYLCKCIKCNAIMFDENPNVHSGPIDITTIKEPINHMIQFHDGGEFYWGCPNCSTDSYLMDFTNDDFKK